LKIGNKMLQVTIKIEKPADDDGVETVQVNDKK
jgi:hypothetical protein